MSYDFNDVSQLNYDLSKVKNKDELFVDGNLNPKTCAIVLLSEVVGFNEINKKNIDENLVRIHIWESVFGHYVVDANEQGLTITRDDLARHEGLLTNKVSISRAQFLKRLWEQAQDITL